MQSEPGKGKQQQQQQEPQDNNQTCCCRCWNFGGHATAIGYNCLGLARGAIVMSNIFLATSFVFLASEQAGCVDDEGELFDECNKNVYGFRPAALVSNIAVITGLLSAFFMPLCGALVDCTNHRRLVGIIVSCLITLIQAIQIGTVSGTWYPMLMLQALAGFLYQVLVLSNYAYLPDMARVLGEEKMTKYTATWMMSQFGSQITFLLLVIILGMAGSLDDVTTAQFSQCLNAVWSIAAFCIGWYYMPNAPAARQLETGSSGCCSLFTHGFVQIFRTVRDINKSYKKGLRWYLLALVFAESAVNAFTTVSVVFLGDKLKFSGTEIGIFFLVTLLGSFPGGCISSAVSKRTNPNTSWKLSQVAILVVAIVGANILRATPIGGDQIMVVANAWGFVVGICLGWFYPTENLFFSMILPQGQEAELAGFFVYCTQILGWLPPLIFSILVQNDIDQTYGLMAVACFILPSLLALSMTTSWEGILEEVGHVAPPV